MDTNENEKKPKRPRIGQSNHAAGETNDFSRYEKVNYGKPAAADGEGSGEGAPRYQRPYQPRNNYNNPNRQGGYYNNGGYNNRQNYQPRPRPDYTRNEGLTPRETAEGADGEATQSATYQPRYNNNYNRQEIGRAHV